MELYFNPYPGAAKDEHIGVECAVKTADALLRLTKELGKVSLSGVSPGKDVDISPSRFVLIRTSNTELGIGDIIFKTKSPERDKLRLLLQTFSRGRVIDANELNDIEDWILENIGTAAPILESAAKKKRSR